MELEKKCETTRESLRNGQVSDDDYRQSPIAKLPVECLISIFSLLPIADRVRIQRVCKHWRYVSLMSWSSCKTLCFEEEDWGYKYWLGRGIDLFVFKKVLKLCGPHVTCIEFPEYYEDPAGSRFVKLLKADKSLFMLIKSLCPKLTSIDIGGLEVTVEGLEYLGENYSKLTEFVMDGYKSWDDDKSVNFDKPLSLLFRNNKNLRRVELNIKSDGNCLLNLNPTAVEVISVVHGLGGEENICRALRRFVNLSSLSITDWFSNDGWSENDGVAYMNEMLEAIEPHSENLKQLDISTVDFFPVVIYSKNFKCFSNLQKLVLEGEELKIDFNTIVKYCTKLTCVNLMDLSVTDSQMASIIQLPELKELDLRCLHEITDAIFVNRVCSLKILECYNCSQLTHVGFRSLLKNAPESLQSLAITECEKVDLNKLIQDAKEATDSRGAGSILRILVDKRDEISVQKKKVTKLSEYLELTKYISN